MSGAARPPMIVFGETAFGTARMGSQASRSSADICSHIQVIGHSSVNCASRTFRKLLHSSSTCGGTRRKVSTFARNVNSLLTCARTIRVRLPWLRTTICHLGRAHYSQADAQRRQALQMPDEVRELAERSGAVGPHARVDCIYVR